MIGKVIISSAPMTADVVREQCAVRRGDTLCAYTLDGDNEGCVTCDTEANQREHHPMSTEAGATSVAPTSKQKDISPESQAASKPHSLDGLRLALYRAQCWAVERQASYFVGCSAETGWFACSDSNEDADPADLLIEVTPLGAAKRYLDPLEWQRAPSGENIAADLPADDRPACYSWPVQPGHIDAGRHFFDAFGNMETEVSARWIVRFCQERGRSWEPFTYADIDGFYRKNGVTDGFRFNRLIGMYGGTTEFITVTDAEGRNVVRVEREGKETYAVTSLFVERCIKSSPRTTGMGGGETS